MPKPGRPQHDLPPERLIETKRREVQEVRDHADPRQRTTAACRQHGHFRIALRYIHLRSRLIVDGELVHRSLAQCQRPLIGFNESAHVVQTILRKTYECGRECVRLCGVDVEEQLSIVREDGGGFVGRAKAVRWPAHEREQGDLVCAIELCAFERFGRREANSRRLDRSDSLQAKVRRESRHAASVEHRDARREPRHEDQAQRDAKVPVGQDEPLAHWG